MKKILSLTLIASVIVLCFHLYFKTYNPCDTPILYKIGIIDPKFGLTHDEVLIDSQRAVEILSNVYGKNLFFYSPDKGELTINFVFDERSELNVNINKKLNNIDEESSVLQQKIKVYEEDVKIFESKLNEYNKRVQKYNSEGGAPTEIYSSMEREQGILQLEGNALNKRAEDLNLAAKNYNLNVDEFNKNVNDFNQALIEKPEEGLFDPVNNSITVYFVNNKAELIHTLAHELGHAMSMDHVANPRGIMYALSSNYLELTADDVQELYKACKDIPAYQYWGNKIIHKVTELRLNAV